MTTNDLDILGLQQESERLKEQGNKKSGFSSNIVRMPEKAGAIIVRLLPPAAAGMFGRDVNPFFHSTRLHTVNGKSQHCRKELVGKKYVGNCPICDYYNHLWQESKTKSPSEAEAMQDRARAIKPVERYYYNCIVRRETDEDGNIHENVGPKILSIGKTLHSMIVRGILGSEEFSEPPLGNVANFITGRDFKIIKTIRSSNGTDYPNYDTSKFLDVSALEPELIERAKNDLHDLVALRTPADEEVLKIELKRHLGILKNESSNGFDPSEYERPQEKVVVTQKEVIPSKPDAVDLNATAAAAGTDSELDPSFLEIIRNING